MDQTRYRLTSGGNITRTWRPSKALDRQVRRTVFARDGYVCLNCGYRPTAEDLAWYHAGHHRSPGELTLDHIVPYRDGGPFTAENLQTLCCACNQRKGAGA